MYQIIANQRALQVWMQSVAKRTDVLEKHLGIKKELQQVVACLDRDYGSERDLQCDLGGYVVILYGNAKEIKKHYEGILKYHHLKEEEYEYEERCGKFECQEDVVFRLYLCSSDYAVGILMIEDKEEM